MPSISYAITACNEHIELDRLLDQLSSSIRDEDEIVVQMDITATDEVKAVVNKYKLMSYFHPLNNDFATFKNNLKSLCTKDYIFQIDADEYLSEELMEYMPGILDANPDVEMFSVPRVNTVEGLTEAHIKQWGWYVNQDGWVNYPDYQNRILKNKSEIHWINKVHEKIIGAMIICPLPEGFDLYHFKTIENQEKQNNYYNEIFRH
jgi:glycosyltransferase involved in cell wall biosynthesis